MHIMFPAIGLMTFLLIGSFLLFFMASKTSGLTATFGRLLGIWLLLIAAVGAGGVATAFVSGGKPYGLDMPMMRGERMRCCQGLQPEAPRSAPEAPPAQPAPPAPPAEGPAKSDG